MARVLVARKISDNYWQVDQLPTWANKWWTARCFPPANKVWHITNHRGTEVRQTSALGRCIIAAIKAIGTN